MFIRIRFNTTCFVRSQRYIYSTTQETIQTSACPKTFYGTKAQLINIRWVVSSDPASINVLPAAELNTLLLRCFLFYRRNGKLHLYFYMVHSIESTAYSLFLAFTAMNTHAHAHTRILIICQKYYTHGNRYKNSSTFLCLSLHAKYCPFLSPQVQFTDFHMIGVAISSRMHHLNFIITLLLTEN